MVGMLVLGPVGDTPFGGAGDPARQGLRDVEAHEAVVVFVFVYVERDGGEPDGLAG